MADDDLAQRDLSHLAFDQMNAAERAEMRRRYEAFLRALGRLAPAPGPGPNKQVPRPWNPAKARPQR